MSVFAGILFWIGLSIVAAFAYRSNRRRLPDQSRFILAGISITCVAAGIGATLATWLAKDNEEILAALVGAEIPCVAFGIVMLLRRLVVRPSSENPPGASTSLRLVGVGAGSAVALLLVATMIATHVIASWVGTLVLLPVALVVIWQLRSHASH